MIQRIISRENGKYECSSGNWWLAKNEKSQNLRRMTRQKNWVDDFENRGEVLLKTIVKTRTSMFEIILETGSTSIMFLQMNH